MKSMELVFVRHAEPDWSKDGISQMDPPLTARGRDQAELCANYLQTSGKRITELLVSPALRSQETAAAIARKIDVAPQTIDDLVEIRLPDWAHLSPFDVAEKFRESRRRELDAWWEGIEGGESFRAFHARIQAIVLTILRDRGITPREGQKHLYDESRDAGRVVIVAHGGANSVAMGVLLGIEPVPWEWERLSLFHTSLVRVSTMSLGGGVVFSLRSSNEVEHLPKGMRTR